MRLVIFSYILIGLLLICVIFSCFYLKDYFRRRKHVVIEGKGEIEWNNNLKIVVLGHTGSGKSTISKFLSETLGIEHVELDILQWKKNWKANKNIRKDFLRKLRDLKKKSERGGWVIDGNYHRSIGFDHYKDVDIVIYLDIPPLINWTRLIYRTLVERLILRKRCCGENIESLRVQLFSKESLFYYFYYRSDKSCFRDHDFYKKKGLGHLRVYHLASPYEVSLFKRDVVRRNKMKRRI